MRATLKLGIFIRRKKGDSHVDGRTFGCSFPLLLHLTSMMCACHPMLLKPGIFARCKKGLLCDSHVDGHTCRCSVPLLLRLTSVIKVRKVMCDGQFSVGRRWEQLSSSKNQVAL